MATSTVLRVKRRLEDNPQDALLILCKRQKIDSEEISPSLFVFRGSVENQLLPFLKLLTGRLLYCALEIRKSVENQEPTHVKNISPNKIPLKQITNVNDIIQKIRKERKDVAAESRYEIVNCSRGLKEAELDNYDLVDLEKKEDGKKDVDYIYDLYTPAKEDFDVSMLDNIISIENYETDLIFGTYRDNGLAASDDEDDSEDSNAENDWRNEYPDSDPSSIDEEDMVKAVEKCNLEDDLSSDTEDKIYDEPADLFNEDVKRYGAAYAKYKARVLVEQPDITDSRNLVHCSKMDTEGYKDDSDDGFYYGQEEDSEHFKEQYAEANDSSDAYEPD